MFGMLHISCLAKKYKLSFRGLVFKNNEKSEDLSGNPSLIWEFGISSWNSRSPGTNCHAMKRFGWKDTCVNEWRQENSGGHARYCAGRYLTI